MLDHLTASLTAALDRACRASGFDDYMPGQMIGHFVRQVVPVSLEGDRFRLDQFYQWVRQEYSVPDSAFGRAFNQFGPEAARMGVTVIEPEGFDPGFGETIRNWLIGTVEGNAEQAAAAAAAPVIPIAPLAPEPVILPPDYELPAEPVHYWVPVTDDSAPLAEPAPEEMLPPAIEVVPEEAVTYGVPVEEPAAAAPEAPIEEIAVPLDDSAIVADPDAEALPALVIEPAAGMAEVSPSASADELERLRTEVAEQLRRELWPAVYDEVRAMALGEVRPAVEAELRERMEPELRPEIERVLRAELREQLFADLHEEVTAEIRAAEHAPIAAEIRGRIEAEVREQLRRELWDEVRNEVRDDLRSVMRPALEAEIRQEIEESRPEPEPPPAEAAPAAETGAPDPRGLGLGADDQLFIIRRLRERMAPELREQFARELNALATTLRERESEAERQRRMSHPDFCREQVRLYFFSDQPALWERVKSSVDPNRWQSLAAELATGKFDRDKLERARPAIREALIIKAEIETELGAAPPRGTARPKVLADALAGADRTLDFALERLGATIRGI